MSEISSEKKEVLRNIPSISDLLNHTELKNSLAGLAEKSQVSILRAVVQGIRDDILEKNDPELEKYNLELITEKTVQKALQLCQIEKKPQLKQVINATGVIIHTNLGRSCLSDRAIALLNDVAGNYCNLEYDLKLSQRGSRQAALEKLLTRLSGAQAALVVNNNAAAVFLILATFAAGKEVIVSRGELIEIGGSFRMPEVMSLSGVRLVEVGTTNRTYVKDYASAITPETAILLKVHPSNYHLMGFTHTPSSLELANLAHERGLLAVEDLGSSTLLDLNFSEKIKVPSASQSLSEGMDLVCFSADKLLGGPQAGIILGSNELVQKLKANHLSRAFRTCKLTNAALEGTLLDYFLESEPEHTIPTLRMLHLPAASIKTQAYRLVNKLKKVKSTGIKVSVKPEISKTGGGSLPDYDLKTYTVAIESANISILKIEEAIRNNDPPIIGRISEDALLLDLRTVHKNQMNHLYQGIRKVLEEITNS